MPMSQIRLNEPKLQNDREKEEEEKKTLSSNPYYLSP